MDKLSNFKLLAPNVIESGNGALYFTKIDGAGSLSDLTIFDEMYAAFSVKEIMVSKSDGVLFDAVLLTADFTGEDTENDYSVSLILSDFGNYVSASY